MITSKNKSTTYESHILHINDYDGQPVYFSELVNPVIKQKISIRQLAGIDLSGDFVIVTFDNLQFFHTVTDILGPAAIVKEQRPDAKYLVVTMGHFVADDPKSNLIKGFLELIDVDVEDVISLRKVGDLRIKGSVFYGPGEPRFITDGPPSIISLNSLFPFKQKTYKSTIKAFRKLVFSKIKKPSKPINKIFLDRTKENMSIYIDYEQYGIDFERKQISKNFMMPVADEETERYFLKKYNGIVQYLSSVHSRMSLPQTMDSVKEKFVDLGYTVVDMSELDYLEQASLIYHATHIAGYEGSSMTHLLTIQPGTVVALITHAEHYHFWYAQIAEENDARLVRIPGKPTRMPEALEHYNIDKLNVYSKEELLSAIDNNIAML